MDKYIWLKKNVDRTKYANNENFLLLVTKFIKLLNLSLHDYMKCIRLATIFSTFVIYFPPWH